jgi:hypothetical protein
MQVVSLAAFATVAADPIRAPDDLVTNAIVNHVTLERGATVGLLVLAVGVGFGLTLVGRWAASGFTRLPFVINDVLVLTAVVLGLQLVFNSFFLSAVADRE